MSKVRALILIGEAKERINAELGRYSDTYMENDLADAVKRALQVAKDGDVVLFLPGAAVSTCSGITRTGETNLERWWSHCEKSDYLYSCVHASV